MLFFTDKFIFFGGWRGNIKNVKLKLGPNYLQITFFYGFSKNWCVRPLPLAVCNMCVLVKYNNKVARSSATTINFCFAFNPVCCGF